MNEVKNFRTAFEENSEYSSIQYKELLRDTRTGGTIQYFVYGASESGLGREKNGDNIYLNGIYMRSFQFTNYSKGIETEGESALFAVAGFPSDDNWAKGVFEDMDHKYAMTLFESRKLAEKILAQHTSRYVRLPDKTGASFGALLVTGDGAAACTLGPAGVFRYKKERLLSVAGSRKGNETSLLSGNLRGRSEDVYVMCSGGLLLTMEPETIAAYIGRSKSIRLAVKSILERAGNLTNTADVSVIIIRVQRKRAWRRNGHRV